MTYYEKSCPQIHQVVKQRVTAAVNSDGDRRIAASVARLLFHDCFVEVSFSIAYSQPPLKVWR